MITGFNCSTNPRQTTLRRDNPWGKSGKLTILKSSIRLGKHHILFCLSDADKLVQTANDSKASEEKTVEIDDTCEWEFEVNKHYYDLPYDSVYIKLCETGSAGYLTRIETKSNQNDDEKEIEKKNNEENYDDSNNCDSISLSSKVENQHSGNLDAYSFYDKQLFFIVPVHVWNYEKQYYIAFIPHPHHHSGILHHKQCHHSSLNTSSGVNKFSKFNLNINQLKKEKKEKKGKKEKKRMKSPNRAQKYKRKHDDFTHNDFLSSFCYVHLDEKTQKLVIVNDKDQASS